MIAAVPPRGEVNCSTSIRSPEVGWAPHTRRRTAAPRDEPATRQPDAVMYSSRASLAAWLADAAREEGDDVSNGGAAVGAAVSMIVTSRMKA